MLNKNIFSNIIFLTLVLTCANASAFTRSSRGFFKSNLKTYSNDTNNRVGQFFQLQLENNFNFSENLSLKNQLRSSSTTLIDDIGAKYKPMKKDRTDIFPGENYIKLSTDKFVIQAGYQEVIWGEAFGLYYADFITPRDLRETIYTDVSEARLPNLLLNSKYFFNSNYLSGSLQILFSPEPKFNKQLPLDLFTGDVLPTSNIEINRDESKIDLSQSEWGGKLSMSIEGHDLSFYNFNYFDRNPYYTLNSISTASLKLDEKHSMITSSGLSYAKTIYDFVLRSDIVQTKNKKLNFFQNQQLSNDQTDTLDFLISLDSPTYNNYSGLIVFGQSTLTNTSHTYFRSHQEQYIISKISKAFENDHSFDISYTHEFSSGGNAIQSQFNIPINNTLEFKLGSEFYFGQDDSNFNRLKKINNIFISLKSFFQL